MGKGRHGHSWEHVHGVCSVYLVRWGSDGWANMDDPSMDDVRGGFCANPAFKALPKSVSTWLNAAGFDSECELLIQFSSSGWSSEGVSAAPVERSSPPDGDEDRVRDGPVIVCVEDEMQQEMPESLSDSVFNLFESEVWEVELVKTKGDRE